MSFVLAVVALILAIAAYRRVSWLEQRMERVEKAVLEVALYAHTTARAAGGRVGEPAAPSLPAQTSLQEESSLRGEEASAEAPPSPTPASVPSPTPAPSPVMPAALKGTLAQLKGQEERAERFVAWLKEEWPMKLGAALFLIGMGWFVSYAIAQGWIGVQGRVALSFLAGAALLAVGVARIRQGWRHQGGILVAVGATTLLFTNWLAWYYELITPLASLVFIFAVVVFVGVLSVVYAMRSLAIVGFLLSGVAPVLTTVAPWQPGVVPMLLYLFAVICGTLWLALFAGWIELVPATLLLVFLHYVPLWDNARHLSDFEQTIAFAAALGLTGIIWLAGTMGLAGYLWNVGSYPERSRRLGYAATAFLNAFFFAYNIFIFVPDHLQSLWLAGGSALFALGAYVGARLARDPTLFLPYGLAGFALFLTALMRELEGAPLLVLTTAASVAFVLVTLQWGRTVLNIAIGVSTLLIPTIASLPVWQEAAEAPKVPWNLLDASLLALLLFVAALAGTAYLLYLRAIDFERPKDVRIIAGVVGTFAFLFSLRIVWIVFERLFSGLEIAVFVTLAVYTIVGITLYFRGMEKKVWWMQRYGAVLIGFVVLRLLLVDVARLDLFWRTITFISLGLLLLATGYWRQQVLERLGFVRPAKGSEQVSR